MTLRRVTVPGGGQFGQTLQDSVSRLTRDIDEQLLSSYGIPTKVLFTDYRPKFGELVRLDARDSTITVTLPMGSPNKIGKALTIANVSSGINAVTILPADGTINGDPSVVITKAYFLRQLSYLGLDENGQDLWLLTAVRDGGTSEGVAPFFRWNNTDLSQFGSIENGTGNSMTASVISNSGLNWISLSGNATAAANWPGSAAFLPVTSDTPPTKNYILRADVQIHVTSGNFVTAGLMVRQTAGTGIGTGYNIVVLTTVGTTGSVALGTADAAEGNTGYHNFTTGEALSSGKGYSMEIGVEGATHLVATAGNEISFRNPSGTYNTVGNFGIVAGGQAAGTNSYTVYFRNIRAFEFPVQSE